MSLLPDFASLPWVQALGWTLLHSLWQGGLIAAIIALLCWRLGPRAAQARYLSTVAGLLLMVVAAGITFMHGYDAASEASPFLSYQLVEDGLSDFEPFDPLPVKEPILPWESLTQQITPILPWLSSAWLFGLLLLGLRWVHVYLFTQSLRYRGAQPMDYNWQTQVNELAMRMGLMRNVWLIESNRVQSPMTIGHLKPVILVPVGLLAGLPPAQVEAILSHELAHIRRYDYLINLLMSLVELVFFYHPAIWWLGREMRQAREHCCDDLAVAVCGDARQYVETLASLAASQPGSTLAPGLLNGSKPLLQRVKRLLAPQTLPSSHGHVLLAGGLLLFCLGTGWLSPAQAGTAEESWDGVMTGPLGDEVPWFANASVAPAPTSSASQWVSLSPLASETPAAPLNRDRGLIWTGLPDASDAIWDWSVCVDSPPPTVTPPNVPEPLEPMTPEEVLRAVPPPPEMPSSPPVPPMPKLPMAGDSSMQAVDWEAYSEQMAQWGEAWGEAQEEVWEAYAQQVEEWAEEYAAAWEKDANSWEEWAEQKAERTTRMHEEMIAREEELASRREEIMARKREAKEIQAERLEREAERQQREAERLQREVERQQRGGEKVRREAERQQREAEQLQREEEQLQREAEELQRQAEDLQREAEGMQRRLEEEQRAMERAHRELEREVSKDARRLQAGIDALQAQLFADGLIDDREAGFSLRSKEGKLKINGKKMEGEQYNKYRNLLLEMGVNIDQGEYSISTD